MKPHVVLVVAALVVLVVLFEAGERERDRVEIIALTAENWEDVAPDGKEVDAIAGDFVLRNGHIVAVIAQPLPTRHANMTVRNVGGAVIDLTVRREESDQLSAFYPGRRNYPYNEWSASVDDETVAADAKTSWSGSSGSITVRAPAAEQRPAVEVTYSLNADAHYLTVTSKLTNAGSKPLAVTLEDDVRADGGKEQMVKSPNGPADLFWIDDQYWRQAYGVDAPDHQVAATSDPRMSVLRYLAKDGEDAVTLAPGQSVIFTRRIFPGANVLDVKAVAGQLRGKAATPVRLAFTDGNGAALDRATIEVLKADTSLGSGVTNAEGQLLTSLSSGSYRANVTAWGLPVSTNKELTFEVPEQATQQRLELKLQGYRPGTVKAAITDADGRPIPCKVEFVPHDDASRPRFGPETAAYGVLNLRYTPDGTFEQPLPPGRYHVTISHGPEHDAIFTELTVPPGQAVPLTGTLVRTVETPGWVSSDFHSHSSPSGDNTGSQLGRVLNLVVEHIEFAPCTEHNRIDTYEPHIETLGIGRLMTTISGIELTGTPLPLNHQNAFPLIRKPYTQDGGAPVTDTDPEKQIERLALWDDRSEKLLQQNHPDIGWLFYDRNGDGEPDAGFERSHTHIDAMEIHPVQGALDLQPALLLGNRPVANRVFGWLQLLNQGYRIPGVVNTDAHYNYHGSGGLRNWIQSSTDDPSAIDPLEMVHMAEGGRVIVSNGPYLEVTASETGKTGMVTAGQDLAASSGKVRLHVRVQCPNWLNVDRVFVLVNGRPHSIHDYRIEQHPDKFRSGVVKFDETLELNLEADAHVIVVTGGETFKVGPVMGPAWGEQPPAALSNPIFVDVDGNGFQPNKDTLGHPLPVKFDAKK